MKRKNPKNKRIIAFICLILVLFLCFFTVVFKIRPILLSYSKNYAKTVMHNASNEAVMKVIDTYDISYDKISRISRDASGKINSIEIDTGSINKFKSAIAKEISGIVAKNNELSLKIPAGTLTGNDYLIGLGPKLKFKVQMAEACTADFESEFTAAGINHVLHRIIIKIKLTASVLILGATKSFSVDTSAVAAQTVIVGEVPDTFTNVEEHPSDDIADELFNFADLE